MTDRLSRLLSTTRSHRLIATGTGVALVFVIFTVIWVQMVRNSWRSAELEIRRSLDRAASGIMESLIFEDYTRQSVLSLGISALGLYDAEGEKITGLPGLGEAPSTIDPMALLPPFEPVFAASSSSLVLVRPRRTIHIVMPLESAGEQPEKSLERSDPRRDPVFRIEYLYLQSSAASYLASRGSHVLSGILGPLLFGALCIAFSLLVSNNLAYREKIAAEQHLVGLGHAARILAHEIRNPLGSIRIQTGLARALVQDGASRELGIIEQEVERVSALVDHVGDFIKDSRGKPTVVDLDVFLREIPVRFGDVVRLAHPGTAEAVPVFVDPERLQSIVENLVRNALESGGVPVVVSLSRMRERVRGRQRRFVRVDVKDNGPGIPAADRERLFSPLYTTKSDGWGLGLSIVKLFVEAADGRISCAFPPEGGTVMSFELPEAVP